MIGNAARSCSCCMQCAPGGRRRRRRARARGWVLLHCLFCALRIHCTSFVLIVRSIEVYAVDRHERIPQRVFSHQLSEAVTSVAAGNVATPTYQEIIAASYSGRIMSFTSEPVAQGVAAEKMQDFTAHKTATQRQKKLAVLQGEVTKLEDRIEKERHRIAAATSAVLSRPAVDLVAASAIPVAMSHTFSQREDGVYVLTVQLDTPIDCVCVKADMRVELDDEPDSSVIVCRTPAEGDALVATYRMCSTRDARTDLLQRLRWALTTPALLATVCCTTARRWARSDAWA